MAKKLKVKTKGEKETKIDQQLKKYFPFFAGLIVLGIVFVVLYFAFAGLGKVNYEGLTFVKEKYGEISVYSYSYVTKLSSGNLREIYVLLRVNPAENGVPVEGAIVYPAGKKVYLSINNTGLTECEDAIIAINEFDIFLKNNDIPLKAGTPDKDESIEKNSTYITCASYPSSLTIELRAGEETKITRTGGYCYEMEVANCEILPAMEKFIVQSIVDAKRTS